MEIGLVTQDSILFNLLLCSCYNVCLFIGQSGRQSFCVWKICAWTIRPSSGNFINQKLSPQPFNQIFQFYPTCKNCLIGPPKRVKSGKSYKSYLRFELDNKIGSWLPQKRNQLWKTRINSKTSFCNTIDLKIDINAHDWSIDNPLKSWLRKKL